MFVFVAWRHRYLGSGTALCLLQFTIVLALIAWMRYPRIPRTHVLFICFNAALLVRPAPAVRPAMTLTRHPCSRSLRPTGSS